jgi:PAS domain S-box-containing protein
LDNNQPYKALFDAGPDAMIITNEKGKIIMVNNQAELLFGYAGSELTGNQVEILMPSRFQDEHVTDRENYTRDPVPRKMGNDRKIRGRKKDGSEFIAEICVSPVKLDGKLMIASSVRDVTERIEKDEKLLNDEKQFRYTLDNLLELVVILDHKMRYVYINRAGIEQIGFPKEELIGFKISEKFPGFEFTDIYRVYKECLEKRVNRHLETEFVFPNGSTGWFEIRVQPVPEGILVFSVDRTVRLRVQQKLVEQKKFFETILNNLPADIAVFDRNHHYLFLNPRAVKNDELREWLIGKDDFDYVQRKGLDVSVAEKRRAQFNSVVSARRAVAWIDEYTLPEGTQFILRKMHPFFDGDELQYVIGYGIDVTDSKLSEVKLQQLYSDLKNANRELEQFSYMVSHDLQEPLRMVTGFLNLLKLETQELLSDESKTYIDFASDGAERMKEMIKDLLQYSRIGTSKEDFSEVNLNELITYVQHVLKERIREKSAVIKFSDLGTVTGIETLLSQLFMNLVSNALKYNNTPNPVIEIGRRVEADQFLFYVKDNGIGIDPKFFDKIFGIFHRLHGRNEYSGTGVGLAISKKIVEKHGGRIWVDSQPGNGAVFYFTILKNMQ